jgi:hypothetical protein
MTEGGAPVDAVFDDRAGLGWMDFPRVVAGPTADVTKSRNL